MRQSNRGGDEAQNAIALGSPARRPESIALSLLYPVWQDSVARRLAMVLRR